MTATMMAQPSSRVFSLAVAAKAGAFDDHARDNGGHQLVGRAFSLWGWLVGCSVFGVV